MYPRGFGHKPMCPYCGGMHPANECPMMMYPPAMPMPSVPMPPMGGMPMGGYPGGMPAGGMPMGGCPGGMPPGGMPADMMAAMQAHMAKVEKVLADLKQCCDQNSVMLKDIYLKMAKG